MAAFPDGRPPHKKDPSLFEVSAGNVLARVFIFYFLHCIVSTGNFLQGKGSSERVALPSPLVHSLVDFLQNLPGQFFFFSRCRARDFNTTVAHGTSGFSGSFEVLDTESTTFKLKREDEGVTDRTRNRTFTLSISSVALPHGHVISWRFEPLLTVNQRN